MTPPRVVLIVCTVIIVLAAWTGFNLLTARTSLTRGLGEMRQVRTDLRPSVLRRSPQRALAFAAENTSQAHRDFQSASAALHPLAPLIARLGWLPQGDEIASAPTAAALAVHVSDGLLLLLHGFQPVLADLNDAGNPSARLPIALQQIANQQPVYNHACLQLRDAQIERQRISVTRGSTLSSGLQSLDTEMPRLLALCHLMTDLPNLAGFRHAHTYIVVYQDENELRATGGFIGSVGRVTIRNGTANEHFLGSGLRHENYSIASPDPMRLYNDEPYWLLRNANWSPDFPTSAALEHFFLTLDLRWRSSDIIDVTIPAAAAAMEVTGPLYLQGYHRWVTAQNVASLTDYYTHWTGNHGPSKAGNQDTRRKQFIRIVTSRILKAIPKLSVGQWVKFGRVMSNAIARGDVLMHFHNPGEEALVRQIGADGAINPTPSDYLYVVDSNLSYNKLNPWVHLSVQQDVRVRAGGWLDTHLTLHFHNGPIPTFIVRRQPGRTQDWKGPCAGACGSWNDYASFVRIYVPAGSEIVDQSGWTQPWTPGPAYGKMMFCGYLIVRHNQTRIVHIHYIVPPNVFLWSHGSRYRLLVQHQPGSHPTSLQVSFHDRTVNRAWSIQDPRTNWSTQTSIPHRTLRPIPLPREPGPVVALDHWIEPHLYLGRSPHPGS